MQDQYATTFGGLNKIEFYKGKVSVKKLNLENKLVDEFNNHLMLFYTGITRHANKILLNIKKSGNQFTNYEKLSNISKDLKKRVIR